MVRESSQFILAILSSKQIIIVTNIQRLPIWGTRLAMQLMIKLNLKKFDDLSETDNLNKIVNNFSTDIHCSIQRLCRRARLCRCRCAARVRAVRSGETAYAGRS